MNFPLRDGITDENYRQIFEPVRHFALRFALSQLIILGPSQVIREVMRTYNPGAIVLQCGTDSLSGDKLGCFNLSMRGKTSHNRWSREIQILFVLGHANCVKFVKSFNKPLLLLGGGGYTMRNVSRAWAYETGLAAGVELGSGMPFLLTIGRQ